MKKIYENETKEKLVFCVITAMRPDQLSNPHYFEEAKDAIDSTPKEVRDALESKSCDELVAMLEKRDAEMAMLHESPEDLKDQLAWRESIINQMKRDGIINHDATELTTITELTII